MTAGSSARSALARDNKPDSTGESTGATPRARQQVKPNTGTAQTQATFPNVHESFGRAISGNILCCGRQETPFTVPAPASSLGPERPVRLCRQTVFDVRYPPHLLVTIYEHAAVDRQGPARRRRRVTPRGIPLQRRRARQCCPEPGCAQLAATRVCTEANTSRRRSINARSPRSLLCRDPAYRNRSLPPLLPVAAIPQQIQTDQPVKRAACLARVPRRWPHRSRRPIERRSRRSMGLTQMTPSITACYTACYHDATFDLSRTSMLSARTTNGDQASERQLTHRACVATDRIAMSKPADSPCLMLNGAFRTRWPPYPVDDDAEIAFRNAHTRFPAFRR